MVSQCLKIEVMVARKAGDLLHLPILHDRLIQRHARNQNESRVLLRICRHGSDDLVALLLEHGIVVLRHRLANRRRGERRRTLKGVSESRPIRRQALLDLAARLDRHVEQPDGRVRQLLQAVHAVRAAGDDLDGDSAVVDGGGGDLGGADVAVPRLAGFEVFGQVDPELHADVAAAVAVVVRHLRVHDAPTGCHELEIARPYGSLVAGEVFMIDGSGEEVRNRLLPSMRVIRKPSPNTHIKVIQHEKRAQIPQLRRANRPPHRRASTLTLLFRLENLLDPPRNRGRGVQAGVLGRDDRQPDEVRGCGAVRHRGGERSCARS